MTLPMRPLLALALVAPMGCSPAEDEPTPPQWPTVAAVNAVPDDHELAEGQWRFQYDTWGVEVAEDEWPPPDFLLGLMEDPAFGPQVSAWGFVPDPNDEFPVGLKRGTKDPDKVTTTCALCHVAALPDGRLWFGAPNLALDFPGFRIALNQAWTASGGAALESDDSLAKLAQLGPGRVRAETNAYPTIVPADYPPYFYLGDKPHLNYLGTGRNLRSEAYLSIFSRGAGYPNEEEAVVPFPPEEEVLTFVGFLGQLSAPEPPQSDGDVSRGEAVFSEAQCSVCHRLGANDNGVIPHSSDPDIPETLPDDKDHPRGVIKTDSEHRVLVDGAPEDKQDEDMQDQGYRPFLFFILDKGLVVLPTDGYRATDLRGVWATAPYLHNGSVPTLEDLLKPAAQRPVTFDRLGFRVDTTARGNGNGGHEFGTDLSDADRAALVAYLKTLH